MSGSVVVPPNLSNISDKTWEIIHTSDKIQNIVKMIFEPSQVLISEVSEKTWNAIIDNRYTYMSFLGLDEKELKDLGFDNGQLGGIRFTLGVLKNAKNLELREIFSKHDLEPDAKRQKIANSKIKDITDTICDSIQFYVRENFSPKGNSKKLDLLQDRNKIKKVFDRESKLVTEISNRIGKIGINYPAANKFRNEAVVELIFDLNDNGSTSEFAKVFFDVFENRQVGEYDNEDTCIRKNHLLFAESVETYLALSRKNTSLKIIQNEAQYNCDTTTDDTTKPNNEIEYENLDSLRPDFRLQDSKGRIFQRVEVKSSLKKAKADLTEKCFRLNKYLYGDIKTQFALAIAGNIAVYYLIDFTPTCEKENCNEKNCDHPKTLRTVKNGLTLLRHYDLLNLDDRIALVFNSFVIAELCYQLQSTFRFEDEEDFYSIYHDDTMKLKRKDGISYYTKLDFHYQFNMVEKIVFEEDEISSTELLESFYKTVQESQYKSPPSIRNIVKIEKFKIRPSSKINPFAIKLNIKPIGYILEALMDKVASDIKQFEKAVIYVMEAALSMHVFGYVHRDIRWPNITYDPDRDTYLLFDFEDLGKLCDQCPRNKTHCQKHPDGYYCTPAIYDIAFIIGLFNLPSEYSFLCIIEKYFKYYNFAIGLDANKIVFNPSKNKKAIETVKSLFWEFYETNIGHVENLDETEVKKRVDERKNNAKF